MRCPITVKHVDAHFYVARPQQLSKSGLCLGYNGPLSAQACMGSVEGARSSVIVLFDGVCNLCNGLVTFLINRDKSGRLRFASLQSEVGKRLLESAGVSGVDSVVCVNDSGAWVKSDAILQIAAALGGKWRWLTILRVLPRWWRDRVYDFVAAHRYRWFGRRQACMLASDEIKSRFVENDKSR